MDDVEIRGDTIRLGQLLKLSGIAGSGAEAKALLLEHGVTVNGEPEARRGASSTAATWSPSGTRPCASPDLRAAGLPSGYPAFANQAPPERRPLARAVGNGRSVGAALRHLDNHGSEPGSIVLAEALAHFLVDRCESHHAGWRAVRRVVVDSAADAPWEKCARRAVPQVAEDLLSLSAERGRTPARARPARRRPAARRADRLPPRSGRHLRRARDRSARGQRRALGGRAGQRRRLALARAGRPRGRALAERLTRLAGLSRLPPGSRQAAAAEPVGPADLGLGEPAGGAGDPDRSVRPRDRRSRGSSSG